MGKIFCTGIYFPILAIGQNWKLGNEKTLNNISEISGFSEFPISHFSILLNFLLFLINIFSKSLFYIYIYRFAYNFTNMFDCLINEI